jgi:hypothetical protein
MYLHIPSGLLNLTYPVFSCLQNLFCCRIDKPPFAKVKDEALFVKIRRTKSCSGFLANLIFATAPPVRRVTRIKPQSLLVVRSTAAVLGIMKMILG